MLLAYPDCVPNLLELCRILAENALRLIAPRGGFHMPNNDPVEIGKAIAARVLALRQAARERRSAALEAHPSKLEFALHLIGAAGLEPLGITLRTAGFLVAAGDSWFDYPFFDVLKLLHDNYGYNIESAAHRGDPMETMAYQGGQVDKFARCLEQVLAHGTKPKAVLLSGGGDDIAGKEFGMLLNSAKSKIEGWNAEVLDGVINQRIQAAYRSFLTSIDSLCQGYNIPTPPILTHGYDYPVPDGRGFLGGWPFPGPWLQPGFREKLFDDLPTTVQMMRTTIDEFNTMLSTLAGSIANLHYIDLRGTLSTVLTYDEYQEWWGNELHPTEKGFTAVTDKFAAVLKGLP